MCFKMKPKLLLVILYFVCVINDVRSARILGVFPLPSISHQVVFRKLTQGLARRGHEVTVITTDPIGSEQPPTTNYNEIDVHDVSYQTIQKYYQSSYKATKNVPPFSQIENLLKLPTHLFEVHMQTPQVKELVFNKTNYFDLICIEEFSPISLVFSHLFKAPVIVVSSMGALINTHEIIGTFSHPLLYPIYMNRRIYNRTIWEKIVELYIYYSFKYAFYKCVDYENKVTKKILGPDFPRMTELTDNIHMLFVNIHPIWALNQPVPPSVIYMGGLHQLPHKELPQDLKRYLDLSKNGVIYLSFGTNVIPEMLPQDKVDAMVKVLSSLPYDVLWKWNHDELSGKGDNIRISKWFPQSDLLRHPNVKLFITQAGLQSTDEAISAGVPLVAVPMLGDQWYNAENYVHHGIGIKLDIDTFSADEFKNAIETVIGNDSYRKNIIKLRELLNDSPESPLERAMWWTEYVIRHKGAKQLRPPTANISFAKYYEVKLVIIVVSIAIGALIIFLTLIRYILRFVCYVLGSKNKMKTS